MVGATQPRAHGAGLRPLSSEAQIAPEKRLAMHQCALCFRAVPLIDTLEAPGWEE